MRPNSCARKTGRIVGALTALLLVMKGLPLAYQKDMQEDKEGAIDALGALALSLAAMTGMVRDMRARRRAHAASGGRRLLPPLPILPTGWYANSSLPFREAHHVTGRIVAKAAEAGVALDKLPLATMQAIEPRIGNAVFGVLSVDKSVKSRAVLWRHRAEKRARAGQSAGSSGSTERLKLGRQSG